MACLRGDVGEEVGVFGRAACAYRQRRSDRKALVELKIADAHGDVVIQEAQLPMPVAVDDRVQVVNIVAVRAPLEGGVAAQFSGTARVRTMAARDAGGRAKKSAIGSDREEVS